MKPYYEADGITLYHSDCREVDISGVSAVVTDPPYGLGFMGKGWDKGVPSVEFWERFAASCWPGAHLVAFGGTRTHHRLMCAIEDSGWEIRDCLMWLYGSGYPKSLNLDGEWDGWGTNLKPAWEPIVLARKPLIGNVADYVEAHGVGALNIDACRIEGPKAGGSGSPPLRFGGTNSRPFHEKSREKRYSESGGTNFAVKPGSRGGAPEGRWPANVVLDEEAGAILDTQTGVLTSGANPTRRGSDKFRNSYGDFEGQRECVAHRGQDSGGASRFFYCAKASKQERGERNKHPTVKPLMLLGWLCQLVMPSGGVLWDPFVGSGSTLIKARELGITAVGADKDEESCETAVERLERHI